MAFDIFSQLQGPQIDISLFGDAATAGTNVGNAIPSPFAAATKGVIQGIQQGQEIALNQAKIDDIPLDRQRKERQIRDADTINKINELKLEIGEATKDIEIEKERASLEKTRFELERQKSDIQSQKKVSEVLANPLPGNIESALSDPATQDYLMRNPAQFEYFVNTLKDKADPETQKRLRTNLERSKELAEAAEIKKAELDFQKEVAKDYNKSMEDLAKSSDLVQALGGDINKLDKYTVVPKGTVKTKDGYLVPGEPANPAGANYSDTYEIFDETGKYVRDIDRTQQNTLLAAQNSKKAYMQLFRRANGIAAPAPAAAPQQQGPAVSATVADRPAPYNKEQTIAKVTEQTGLPKEAAERLVNYGVEQGGNTFEKTGVYGPIREIVRTVAETVLPDFIARNIGIPASPAVSGDETLMGAVENQAKTAAARATKILSSGTPEEKEALRQQYKDAGLGESPNYNTIRRFYQDQIDDKLNELYQEAYEGGRALQREENVAGGAKDPLKDLYKNMSVDQVTAVQAQAAKLKGETPQQGVNAQGASVVSAMLPTMTDPKVIQSRLAAVSNSLKLTPGQRVAAGKVATRVNAVPLLNDKPSFVKAVAAVESAGKAGAVSGTGVKGYMQVTKSTAAQYGLNRDIPEENVLAGQLYLEDLMEQFKGSKELAYAAYNAGPGVIRYAQKLAGGSTDWKDVKRYLYDALKRFEKVTGVPASKKIKETYLYPEKVSFYETLFG